jgi:hypothetical protein
MSTAYTLRYIAYITRNRKIASTRLRAPCPMLTQLDLPRLQAIKAETKNVKPSAKYGHPVISDVGPAWQSFDQEVKAQTVTTPTIRRGTKMAGQRDPSDSSPASRIPVLSATFLPNRRESGCRRRDSNPRHADYDSAALTS